MRAWACGASTRRNAANDPRSNLCGRGAVWCPRDPFLYWRGWKVWSKSPHPLPKTGLADIALRTLIYIRGLSDMLTTGNQLKAAWALAGISQAQLAKAASINVTTISAMDGKGA